MSEAAGGSAGAGNPAPGAGDGGGASGGAPTDWTATLPEDVRGVVTTKGWRSPADVIGSYANLEKLLGADKAGRAIVPPKDDAPPEEWAAFHEKLGRPKTPDEYKLPVPEGVPVDFAKAAAGKFHELGLNAKQAAGLAEWWNGHVGGQSQQADAAFAQQSAIDLQDLQREWGAQFEAQSELARRAMREAGLTAEEGKMLERTLGLKKAAGVFAFLGKQFAEAPMKGGEGASRSSFGATPAEAKARIQALKGDSAWVAKYLAGDTDTRSEFERLHRIAFPETA